MASPFGPRPAREPALPRPPISPGIECVNVLFNTQDSTFLLPPGRTAIEAEWTRARETETNITA
jgi:hypothetical protein